MVWSLSLSFGQVRARGEKKGGYVSWQRTSEDLYIAENFRMKVDRKPVYRFFA